jgi:hypothetical protein
MDSTLCSRQTSVCVCVCVCVHAGCILEILCIAIILRISQYNADILFVTVTFGTNFVPLFWDTLKTIENEAWQASLLHQSRDSELQQGPINMG